MDSYAQFFSPTGIFSLYPLAINLQGTTFLGIVLVVLLLISFTISGAEVALFSLNHRDLNMLKTRQNAGAKRIVELLEEPKELYTSLLIVGTFINICIIVLANYLLSQLLIFESWGWLANVLIRVLLIVFVLVFFGKILPKVWATQNNLRFAYGCSAAIETIHLFMRRISRWVVSIADGIGKKTGANRSEAIGYEDLDEAIDIKSDEEASVEEKNIMKGIVKFGNITVKQVMRSRLDVSGISYTSDFTEVARKVEELHYSRIPVYKVNLDDLVGILNTKDLIPYLNEDAGFDWHILLRPPYFVPEHKFIEDLLKEFQQKRIHFAVVVDEFGGTSGIVTMEDILEEVIGDIHDEFDEEENTNRRIDENTFVFEGKTMIHDMTRMMKLSLDTFDEVKGESDSVGGLVLELAGAFPELNTQIRCGDFIFTVMQTEKNRISRVNVQIKPQEV